MCVISIVAVFICIIHSCSGVLLGHSLLYKTNNYVCNSNFDYNVLNLLVEAA